MMAINEVQPAIGIKPASMGHKNRHFFSWYDMVMEMHMGYVWDR
jgi:hypothetical protein